MPQASRSSPQVFWCRHLEMTRPWVGGACKLNFQETNRIQNPNYYSFTVGAFCPKPLSEHPLFLVPSD